MDYGNEPRFPAWVSKSTKKIHTSAGAGESLQQYVRKICNMGMVARFTEFVHRHHSRLIFASGLLERPPTQATQREKGGWPPKRWLDCLGFLNGGVEGEKEGGKSARGELEGTEGLCWPTEGKAGGRHCTQAGRQSPSGGGSCGYARRGIRRFRNEKGNSSG